MVRNTPVYEKDIVSPVVVEARLIGTIIAVVAKKMHSGIKNIETVSC